MVDYIKPIVRRKLDAPVIHTGTNDRTNDVNTLKYVRKLTCESNKRNRYR